MIAITIPGNAKPWRPSRTVTHGGRTWSHPEKGQTEQLTTVRAHAAQVMDLHGHERLEGPVVLSVDVYREPPKSLAKVARRGALADAIRPTTRPDITNIVKAIEDGLSGVVYADDSQVVEKHERKLYGSPPRVEAEVCAWKPYRTTLDEIRGEGAIAANWVERTWPGETSEIVVDR